MTSARYTPTAIALHWLIAAAIVALFALGFYMHGLELSPLKLRLFSYHKWGGVCVFALAVLRLAWRIGHRPPPLPAAMPRLERAVAHAGHHLLYLLMFAIPLIGWLASSAKGYTTVLFGVLPLPDLLAPDPALADRLIQLHWAVNLLLAAVVAGHAAAALRHHFVLGDDVLRRMLPRFASNKETSR